MVTGGCAGWTLDHQRRAEVFSQGIKSDWYALPIHMSGVQYVIFTPFLTSSKAFKVSS
jgi:hypothetical protein